MEQKTREEYEQLSKADQKWALEVSQLLGTLNEDQQEASVEFARTLANCNAAGADPAELYEIIETKLGPLPNPW